ncbi:MAG: oligosaccharide flippase family protein [Bacteroidetes bacterium]|nr:oligosaccharide flippase family protein [Bacteroidota bacterium]
MSKVSGFKNKHFLSLAGNLVISIFSVATMALLYRSMSKSDIGTWFIFLSFIGIADGIRTGFLSTGTVKFYSGVELDRGKKVLGSVWFIALSISILLLLLNAIVWTATTQLQNPQIQIVIKWIGITFLSSLPFMVAIWILLAEEKYELILWLRLVNTGSMFVIIAVLIYIQKITLENLLILNIATNILTSFFCVIWRISNFRTIFKASKSVMLELMHFGKYSLGTTISSTLLKSVDTFIINYFLGPASLAIYNLPCKLMEIVELPLRSFTITGMSAIATAINNNKEEEVLTIFKKYAGMLSFAFIPIVLGGILLADVAINILGGPKYHGTEAANIFRVFLLFSMLYPIDRFNGITLDMLNLPQINLQKVLIMLSFCIIGNLVAIYFFKNLYGVAFVSPVVILSGLFFGNYYLKKHLKYTLKDILVTGWYESKLLINKTITNFQKTGNN